MCGICGIFSPAKQAVDAERVTRMRERMVARGPDGAGLASGPGYALGHRRLAVIDLSEGGRQPMASADGSALVVFNGEIYNFLELRAELEGQGAAFRSRSDTEVLLHGFAAWGFPGLLKRIRGMYGLAIVDTRAHELHLARDPVGKKPVIYLDNGREVIFASTVSALLGALDFVPPVDGDSVHNLVAGLFIHGPQTIFRGLQKLQPGHALSITADGRRHLFTHWAPDFSAHDHAVSDDEWLERIEKALDTAVRRRLVSDVPVGILLSGGVDSSLVTAFAARAAGRVKTFSVAADDPALDESEFAASVARCWETDHHVLHVDSDFRKDLTHLVAGMGEPLADPSMAQVFAIARKAREHVTVALTGDGGDELFGGYTHFLAYHLADRINSGLPGSLHSPLRRFADRARTFGVFRSPGTILRLAVAPLSETLVPESWVRQPIAGSLRDSGHPPLSGADREAYYSSGLDGWHGSHADGSMQAQFRTILPDDYLVKVDNGTMAVSLEARSPFLDVDLAATAMRIPAAARFRHNKPKSLLRRLALRYIGRECVERKKKGFVTPVNKWFRGNWAALPEALLLSPEAATRGWFRPAAIRQMVAGHAGGADHGYALWALVILELWMRIHVQRTLSPGDLP